VAFGEGGTARVGERPLSGWMTVVFLLAVIGTAAWQATGTGSRDWSLDYVGGTVRLIERTVENADAAEREKSGGWSMLSLGAERPEDVRRRGIARYKRAIDRMESENRARDARTVRAHLAFLLADTGRKREAVQQLAILERMPAPCGFCQAMRFLDRETRDGDPPASLEPLLEGWSKTRVRIRLLEATGRGGEAETLRSEERQSAHRRLARMLVLLVVAGCLLYVGTLSLVFELRYPAWRPRVDGPPPVSRWRWADGIGVFVRSELAGIVISALVVWHGCRGAVSFVCLWASFFWFLPVAWLVRRHLAAGPWRDVCRDFRLAPADLTAAQVVRTGLAILSIVWVSGAVMEPVFKWIGGGDVDLSEIYFDPMVMDSPPRMALAGVNAVVWAPLAEELTFRGIIYLSLRSIVRAPIAAFGSAALFAGAHLYSFEASFVVFFTGLVFAYGLERYRTLLPTLLGHALLNFFFVLSNVLTYR